MSQAASATSSQPFIISRPGGVSYTGSFKPLTLTQFKQLRAVGTIPNLTDAELEQAVEKINETVRRRIDEVRSGRASPTWDDNMMMEVLKSVKMQSTPSNLSDFQRAEKNVKREINKIQQEMIAQTGATSIEEVAATLSKSVDEFGVTLTKRCSYVPCSTPAPLALEFGRSIKRCSRCKTAIYCSTDCQTKHWEAGHKDVCKAPTAKSTPALKRSWCTPKVVLLTAMAAAAIAYFASFVIRKHY
ncbi:MAG TPA: zinc finger MYND domain-containing protein [Chlamydiales bacterium]|nr:zinc finger MYND domain-containing protein [Chlamydiales bacterium]